MTTLREAAQQAQQALEALAGIDSGYWHDFLEGPIAALRTALAEQPAEQEPVAWMCSNTELIHKGYQMFSATGGGDWNIPVYTAPQPAIPPGWATAYAAFKGAFDTPLARRRDSGEYAQDARRLLREFNDAMFAAPEAPQPVKRQPLTDEEICAALDIDGADDWTFKVAYAAIAAYERKNGIGGQPSMGAIEKSESEDPSPRPS